MSATDLELIENLDFDDTHPCDAAKDGCENTAKWAVTAKCCTNVGMSCDFHRAVLHKELIRIAVYRTQRWCPYCKAPFTGPDDFTFEPIKAGAS